jgi:hypothetical protein
MPAALPYLSVTRRRGARRRGLAALAATLAVPALVLAGGGAVAGASVATAAHVISVSPGANLTTALQNLRPGDVLQLQPGTYVSHLVRPVLTTGLASAPITVEAADPNNRPLIQGTLKLWGPSYWVLNGLRIQAVDAGADALDIGGGRGWVVENSEFFGAKATSAYANVAIMSDTIAGTGAPSSFMFQYNCVHDAGQSTRTSPTDHNIYVDFAGNSSSGGTIQRNIIYGAPHGAGVKLGNGGGLYSAGPWNVKVIYNTITQSGRQVLLHGDVRSNLIYGNLFWLATQPFTASPKTTMVYVDNVNGAGNVMQHNYGFNASMMVWGGSIKNPGDDNLGPNPVLSSPSTCTGYQPQYVGAQPYGRYGTAKFPPL